MPKITAKFCPQCGGSDLYYENGMLMGYIYHCKKCDYVGAFVVEKDAEIDELPRHKDKNRR
jgi:hypothetical protein